MIDRSRRVRGLLAGTAAVTAVVAARALLPAGTPRIGSPAGIASLVEVPVGGTGLWILMRSHDTTNPVILFLHGGPGQSQLTLNRRNTRSLERCFTVVNWDQRGAGKSYAAIRDTDAMTIDRFIEDTRELSEYLLDRFEQRKLVLVGHSWGSVIGALTAARHPRLFHCYVGIGQVAHMRENEANTYDWTLTQARQRGDNKAVRALQAMGPPPYTGDWRAKTVTQRRLLGKFGGEVYGSPIGAFRPIVGSLLVSREYTLADRVNYFRGVLDSMRLLWPQLMEVDLFTAVPELPIPVFLMEGRHDHEVPPDIAQRWFDHLRAPAKELRWFDNSAHMPNTEERETFNRVLLDRVLPIALAGERGGTP